LRPFFHTHSFTRSLCHNCIVEKTQKSIDREQPTTEELRLIARFRSRSLDTLLNLCDLHASEHLPKGRPRPDIHATGRLVGIAFSLWRAAPLVHAKREHKA
jgi:hypothetical protein